MILSVFQWIRNVIKYRKWWYTVYLLFALFSVTCEELSTEIGVFENFVAAEAEIILHPIDEY